MNYLIQARFNGADAAIRGLTGDEQNEITAEFEAIRALSGVLDGNQLCLNDRYADPTLERNLRASPMLRSADPAGSVRSGI